MVESKNIKDMLILNSFLIFENDLFEWFYFDQVNTSIYFNFKLKLFLLDLYSTQNFEIARSRYFDLRKCRKNDRGSRIRTAVKRLRYKVLKISVLKFPSFIKRCFNYVPIRPKSSYSASSYWAGKFLFGLKVLIGPVLIGRTPQFIWLKNTSQSARFRFLLGTPPVIMKKFKINSTKLFYVYSSSS